MSRKPRDYRAEYRRRIARGVAKGLSRAQARGHPRAGEGHVGTTRSIPATALDAALAKLREGASLTRAAASAGVSRERFRRYVADKALARRDGRAWVVADARARRVLVISNGATKNVLVSEFEAERAGRHWNDVGRFLRTNDLALLAPHRGESVRTIDGRVLPFETDPNTLHRLASAGLPAFHEIYQIVQP